MAAILLWTNCQAYAVGRHNWLFAASERGALAVAVHFSLIATCRRHQVDPWSYLRDLLTRLPVLRDAGQLTPEHLRPIYDVLGRVVQTKRGVSDNAHDMETTTSCDTLPTMITLIATEFDSGGSGRLDRSAPAPVRARAITLSMR